MSSSSSKMVGTRVYVGGLPYGVREKDLERFFKGYGRIRDVLIKDGFGFVEFDEYRDADDAVYELHGKELMGERVIVEHARGTARWGDGYGGSSRRRASWIDKYGPPARTEYRLTVENLSSRVSWQDLKDYMRQAGEVTYADAHKQRRNEGVVEFASYRDMKNALEKLDDRELNGRRIHLVKDRRSKRSRSSPSRSRSRSRSHRRSRSRSRSRSPSRRSSRSRSRSHGRSSRNERGRHSDKDREERVRSRSPRGRSRSHSRSKSKTPREQSKSPSRSRSRSPRSRSRSPSPMREEPEVADAPVQDMEPAEKEEAKMEERSENGSGGARSRSPSPPNQNGEKSPEASIVEEEEN